MKKVFSFVAVSLALVLSASLISCKAPSGGGSLAASKYNVGDIVLNDGSYLRDVTSVSNEDKAKSIAVIYKVSGGKAYGVGIRHFRLCLAWCSDSAKGYNKKIDDIICTPNGSAGDLQFTGDTDGSDNLAKIKTALGNADDTGNLSNYPAFEFAENYKDVAGSNVKDTAYETGWYFPTISELFDIWKVKGTVDAAIELCSGTKFGKGYYWSSSQSAFNDNYACLLTFYDGAWYSDSKHNSSFCGCCIRVF